LLTVAVAGLGLATPNTWTLTQAVCEKEIVGTTSGLQNFGGNLGGIIAPALTGMIAHRTGSFAVALGVVGVILLLGILIKCDRSDLLPLFDSIALLYI
jgi:dipeptide/tripeptide permease